MTNSLCSNQEMFFVFFFFLMGHIIYDRVLQSFSEAVLLVWSWIPMVHTQMEKSMEYDGTEPGIKYIFTTRWGPNVTHWHLRFIFFAEPEYICLFWLTAFLQHVFLMFILFIRIKELMFDIYVIYGWYILPYIFVTVQVIGLFSSKSWGLNWSIIRCKCSLI